MAPVRRSWSDGATIKNKTSGLHQVAKFAVLQDLRSDLAADIGLVTVRREQIDGLLPALAAASSRRWLRTQPRT